MNRKLVNRKLIVFEINEVPNRVIDTYIRNHPSSSWASVVTRSARFVAATPDKIQLHPKLSWQTFHRGVPDHEHGFVEYNQTSAKGKKHYPPVWELISNAGKDIGCGASIGSYPVPYDTKNVAFYLTDPFAPTFETVPSYLCSFQRLNNLAVQRSGRNVRRGGFGLAEVSSLILNIPRLGISITTLFKTAKQLIAERYNSVRIVRRRNIQALMTFDVVFRQIKKTKPDFSTIFTNHVAASMHRYWAAMFPNDYKVNRMPQEWRETYSGEIDAAMDEADYMLDKLDKFTKDNPEFTVLVVASMGQAAVEHKPEYNQLLIGNFTSFMSVLGFKPDEYRKLTGMEPEYVVEFNSEKGLKKFLRICELVDINGDEPGVKQINEKQCAFLVFQNNIDISYITVNDKRICLADAGLIIESIQDMSGSTAQHVPGGCCFVFNGFSDLSSFSNLDTEHDLVAVTSSVLSALDVESEPYMQSPVPDVVRALKDEPASPATLLRRRKPTSSPSENNDRSEEVRF